MRATVTERCRYFSSSPAAPGGAEVTQIPYFGNFASPFTLRPATVIRWRYLVRLQTPRSYNPGCSPRGHPLVMKNVLTLVFLAACVPILAQSAGSRSTIQQSLGFEDQSSTALTGWFTNPRDTVAADDHIFHSGQWSVRLQLGTQSAAH